MSLFFPRPRSRVVASSPFTLAVSAAAILSACTNGATPPETKVDPQAGAAAAVTKPFAVANTGDVFSAAARLAASHEHLAPRLLPNADAWKTEPARPSLTSPGWRAGSPQQLGGHLPATAAEAFDFGIGQDSSVRVEAKLVGAAGVERSLDHGRAAFVGAYPSTDVVFTTDPLRVEAFYLLRDASAPSTFAWKLSLGSGIGQVSVRENEIYFADKSGREVLNVPSPVAIDAAGVERTAKLAFEGDTVTFSLDTEGLAFPVLLDPSTQTVDWSLLTSTGPGARYGVRLVTDTYRNYTVMFGGYQTDGGSPGLQNDWWEWRDATSRWAQRSVTTAPPVRRDYGMVFDSNRKKIVLFGGANLSVPLGDTWELDITQAGSFKWTQVCTTAPCNATLPPIREQAAMVYDPVRNVTVLFGGKGTGGTALADTWEWNGAAWTQKAPAGAPSARYGAAATYDSTRSVVLLFGGTSNGTAGLSDTYEYNGTAWTVKTPASGNPPACWGAMLVYWPARRIATLVGGQTNATTFREGTHDWENFAWTTKTIAHPPTARANGGAAMFSTSGILMYGGKDSTAVAKNDTYLFQTFAGTCTSDAQCTGGTFCVDNVCCNTTCGRNANGTDNVNDCQACSVTRGAAVDGTCGTVVSGTKCEADGNLCTNETCNATGTCASAGTSVTCSSPPDTCHSAGTCSPSTGSCSYPYIGDGTPIGGPVACVVNTPAGLKGECTNGLTVCANNGTQCPQSVFPTTETCDSKDNDCDGYTDNPVIGTTANCGGCGLACNTLNASSTACAGSVPAQGTSGGLGNCTEVCNTGFTNCQGTHVGGATDLGCNINKFNDITNCGGCGIVCSSNNITTRTCTLGTCSGACNAGFLDCNGNKLTDGCEVNGNTDTSNCGGCGTTCSSNHVTAACSGGSCGAGTCAVGWSDCDGNKQTNGCEINTAADVVNCGACGTVCSTNNITRACASNSCSAGTCNAGFADCDGNKQTNGCEISTNTDVLNCGACGTICSTNNITRACSGGSCSSGVCSAGFLDCNANKQTDGCEINSQTDVLNCGACGTVCSTNHITRACAAGSCGTGVCATGWLDCNSNKQTDGCETALPALWRDADGDGYGDPATPNTNATAICAATTGWVTNSLDCNDADATTKPGATERCYDATDARTNASNTQDLDCDGITAANDPSATYTNSDTLPHACTSATTQVTVAPGGTADIVGSVDANGTDYFMVTFSSVPALPTTHHPKVDLLGNPGQFRLGVATACSGAALGASACGTADNNTFEMLWTSGTGGTYQVGDGTNANGGSCSVAGNCTDNTSRTLANTLYFAVRRAVTAGTSGASNCAQYVVRVSNINYSTATAPGAPTGTGTDASAQLTWTAPSSNGGGTITDYAIQYSSNGGTSWTTFAHTASTALSQTVTGLTNGTGYIFQVAAVNGAGTGPWSASSATITPSATYAQKLAATGAASAYNVTTDSSGNAYVVGYFSGNITIGSTTLVSAGLNDLFVAKMAPNGTWTWAKSGGGTSDDYGYGIAVDSSGNVYVTGVESGGTFGATTLTTAGVQDVLVAKLDSSGNWLWAKSAGGANADTGNAIGVDSSGNVYVTGGFMSPSPTFATTPTATTLTNAGSTSFNDFFVAKLTSAGAWSWAVKAGSNSEDIAYGIAVDASGNSYVTGGSKGSPMTYINAAGTSVNTSTTGGQDLFVTKLDTTGKFQWMTRGGSAGSGIDDAGYTLAFDNAGALVVAGYFTGATAVYNGITLTNAGASGTMEGFVLRMTNSGVISSAVRFGSTDWDYANAIAVDASNTVYVTGGFYSTSLQFGSNTALANAGGTAHQDAFVAALSSSNTWSWSRRIGGGGAFDETGNGVALGTSSGLFVVGRLADSTTSFGSVSLTPNGSNLNTPYLAKYTTSGTTP